MDSFEKISESADPNTTLVVLVSSSPTERLVLGSVDALNGNFTTWFLNVGALYPESLDQLAGIVGTLINRSNIKRASLIAFDDAAVVAQVLLSVHPQIVRRAVLVDPPSRNTHSPMTHIRERLQSLIPVPLPFRVRAGGFDIRHLQHRISCPLLLVQTGQARSSVVEDIRELSERAPNAWRVQLPSLEAPEDSRSEKEALPSGPVFHPEFVKLLQEFLEVPSKRSQKNIAA